MSEPEELIKQIEELRTRLIKIQGLKNAKPSVLYWSLFGFVHNISIWFFDTHPKAIW